MKISKKRAERFVSKEEDIRVYDKDGNLIFGKPVDPGHEAYLEDLIARAKAKYDNALAKPPRKTQHVVPHGTRWAVRREGSKRATRVLNSREEALAAAILMAQGAGSGVVIHDASGRITGGIDRQRVRTMERHG